MKPSFIGIGALKAGTTSLYSYLGQHPEIYLSPIKEPKFFAVAGNKLSARTKEILGTTITSYREYLALFHTGEGFKAAGEISPIYLVSERAPQNIKAYLPDVKLFAILRDPVDRMFSHYLHNVRSGHEDEIGFLNALSRDEKSRFWNYIPQSRYYAALERYFRLFPRSQLKILFFEDLVADPKQVMFQLYSFIGVDPTWETDTESKKNVTYIPRSRALYRLTKNQGPLKRLAKNTIPGNLKQWLSKTLQSHNQRKPHITLTERRAAMSYVKDDVQNLAQLLGKDLTHWLKISNA
jgi:hypothetical protein